MTHCSREKYARVPELFSATAWSEPVVASANVVAHVGVLQKTHPIGANRTDAHRCVPGGALTGKVRMGWTSSENGKGAPVSHRGCRRAARLPNQRTTDPSPRPTVPTVGLPKTGWGGATSGDRVGSLRVDSLKNRTNGMRDQDSTITKADTTRLARPT